MSSVVRCAVIGLGMGKHHADGYQNAADGKLAAVVDSDPKRLEVWAEKIGSDNCFSDYKTMLKKVKPDLVSVVLPNCLHARVTMDCLKSGAHVLCEKPMAMNLNEARKMAETAIKTKRKLGINLSYRFTPPARALKDLADSGFLGKAYHAFTCWTRRDGFPGFGSWFGQKKMSGGGPLIDLGVHRLDMAMWLMGGPQPISVSGSAHYHIGVPRGKAQRKKFDVEDFATGFVRFDNGASLVFEISWGGHQGQPERMSTIVTGTKGTLVHRNEGGGYNFVGECYSEVGGHKLNGEVAAANPNVKNAYAEMVDCVAHNKPFLADMEDGLRVQRVLDGLYQSAKLGREVRVTA
ncbi:MAG TPA: Gfo/Idh/MocA family oxidoreductase [Planctomycetota bacterium]|jgi:predicted dehydrogenase